MHLIWQIFFPLSLLMIHKYVPFVTIVYGRSRKMREQQKSSFRQIIRFSCTHTHRTCRTWSRIRYRVCVFLCREKHNRGVCKKLSSRKYVHTKNFQMLFHLVRTRVEPLSWTVEKFQTPEVLWEREKTECQCSLSCLSVCLSSPNRSITSILSAPEISAVRSLTRRVHAISPPFLATSKPP